MNNDIVNDIQKDNKEYEWLKPDRIMKLYRGSKSAFGTKKLFVVGVGRNGVDLKEIRFRFKEKPADPIYDYENEASED